MNRTFLNRSPECVPKRAVFFRDHNPYSLVHCSTWRFANVLKDAGWNVSWVWGPIYAWRAEGEAVKSYARKGTVLRNGIWEYCPFTLAPNTRYVHNSFIDKVLPWTFPSVGTRLRKAGFESPDLVVIASMGYYGAARYSGAKRSIFHCTASFWRFGFTSGMMRALESLIEESNLIIAVSDGTKTELMQRFGTPSRKIEVIEHGCEIGDPRRDSTLRDGEAVLVGIPGTTNIEFLKRSCELAKGIQMDIIGPFTSRETVQFAHIGNVRFLGAMPYEAVLSVLPRYLVGLICYDEPTIRRIAVGETGMKYLDYVGAGLAVVSVPMPTFCLSDRLPVLVGNTPREYVNRIRQGISDWETLSRASISFALRHRATNGNERFREIIERLV